MNVSLQGRRRVLQTGAQGSGTGQDMSTVRFGGRHGLGVDMGWAGGEEHQYGSLLCFSSTSALDAVTESASARYNSGLVCTYCFEQLRRWWALQPLLPDGPPLVSCKHALQLHRSCNFFRSPTAAIAAATSQSRP